jgi:DNA polymerase I-like protein with 3'-5' exonuclease and polymerase domains
LVVADYGQLELRVLAHLTNCKSMQDAFLQGGDFHSRTALGMYDHVKAAIDAGARPARRRARSLRYRLRCRCRRQPCG